MFGEGYNQDSEGPEAKFSREELDAQLRRHRADMSIIRSLLDSLTPADAQQELFSWAQIDKWKMWRKH